MTKQTDLEISVTNRKKATPANISYFSSWESAKIPGSADEVRGNSYSIQININCQIYYVLKSITSEQLHLFAKPFSNGPADF